MLLFDELEVCLAKIRRVIRMHWELRTALIPGMMPQSEYGPVVGSLKFILRELMT